MIKGTKKTCLVHRKIAISDYTPLCFCFIGWVSVSDRNRNYLRHRKIPIIYASLSVIGVVIVIATLNSFFCALMVLITILQCLSKMIGCRFPSLKTTQWKLRALLLCFIGYLRMTESKTIRDIANTEVKNERQWVEYLSKSSQNKAQFHHRSWQRGQ